MFDLPTLLFLVVTLLFAVVVVVLQGSSRRPKLPEERWATKSHPTKLNELYEP